MDQEILQQLKEDDRNALRVLFDKYYEPLVRYAIFHLNDIASSEEVVQDIFIYLWEKRYSLRIETSLEPYLYRSIRNRCLNYLKSKSFRVYKLSETADVLTNNSTYEDSNMETEELEKLLAQAIGKISEKSAMIFNYSRNQGLTHPEIASKLNISVKTVEYHIGSALKSIKKYLEKYGYLLLW